VALEPQLAALIDQGKFWALHDVLLRNQKSNLSKEMLKGYAKDLGMDTTVFGQCLDSGTYADKIKNHVTEANELKLSGTPSFVVNGKVLTLQKSYDEVIQAINSEVVKP
jgi:protein-disulfide isomerase